MSKKITFFRKIPLMWLDVKNILLFLLLIDLTPKKLWKLIYCSSHTILWLLKAKSASLTQLLQRISNVYLTLENLLSPIRSLLLIISNKELNLANSPNAVLKVGSHVRVLLNEAERVFGISYEFFFFGRNFRH